MQSDAVSYGANVVGIDDLIATGKPLHCNSQVHATYYGSGGSAQAAGELVQKQGGITLEYVFVVGLPALKGVERLDAPAYVMIAV